jgi:hypothetical protein
MKRFPGGISPCCTKPTQATMFFMVQADRTKSEADNADVKKTAAAGT